MTATANPWEIPPTADRVAVSLVTGFLGSGKTTLINHLLGHPELADTAVIVNEFGEIGLDHELIVSSSETVTILNDGCLCCTVRGDLISTLRDLYLTRARGEVPAFARAVIETTGLADPAPILHTLMGDEMVGAYYRLDGVVTAIDAAAGAATLDRHGDAVKQAAVADRLVLTKTDLVAARARAALEARLRALNPAAPMVTARHGAVDPAALLGAGLYDPRTKIADVAGWLRDEAYEPAADAAHAHDVNRHDDRIRAFCLVHDRPIRADALEQWFALLADLRGPDLLRIKGIVNLAGEDRPLVIHGVQHLFHPPALLEAWPGEDRRTRIVFITRDVARDTVEGLFRTIVADEPATV